MSKDKFKPMVLALANIAAQKAGKEICDSGVALNGYNPGVVSVSGQPMCEKCVYGVEVEDCPRHKAEKVAFQAVAVVATKALERAQSNGQGR